LSNDKGRPESEGAANLPEQKAVGLNIVIVEVRIIAGSQSVFVGGNHALRATLYVVEIKSG